MLKIITVPNNILTIPAKPVTDFNESLKKLIKEMEKTLIAQKDPQGVGLAAPQVGKNLAIFLIKPTPKSPINVFINPKILNSNKNSIDNDQLFNKKNRLPKNTKTNPNHLKTKIPLEGCLSIPKIWSPVKRAKKIFIQYQDQIGKYIKKWFSGFEAVIIQHEIDHLNGILFTQRALEQKNPLYEEKEGKLEKLRY